MQHVFIVGGKNAWDIKVHCTFIQAQALIFFEQCFVCNCRTFFILGPVVLSKSYWLSLKKACVNFLISPFYVPQAMRIVTKLCGFFG